MPCVWPLNPRLPQATKPLWGGYVIKMARKQFVREIFPKARQSLEQALQIREELRDKAGAGVTRHNLKLVAPPTIPTWKLWKLLAGLGAVICAVIVAVAVASKFRLWSPSATPAPTVTSITTPAPASATPAPTVTSISHTGTGISDSSTDGNFNNHAGTGSELQTDSSFNGPGTAPVTPVWRYSVATPPPAVATLAPTITPAGTTTPLPVTPVDSFDNSDRPSQPPATGANCQIHGNSYNDCSWRECEAFLQIGECRTRVD